MAARSEFDISVNNSTRELISRILRAEPRKYESAFKSSLNEARNHVHSISAKEIQKEYHISRKDIRAEQNINMRKARYVEGDLIAEIIYSNFKIPLFRFDVSPKRLQYVASYKKKPVAAHVQKRTARAIITGGFVAQMKSGHIGVFVRSETEKMKKDPRRDALEQRMGHSVAEMLDDVDVRQRIADDTAEYFERRLEHNIKRIVYGG